MITHDVYDQIDIFVNQKDGRSKYPESRFYVDSETAKDKATFIKFLIENNEIIEKQKAYKTIDLCYGSGNLTTHILGDSDITFSELVLNDINADDRNNGIQIGTKQDNDFLDATKFTTKYDLIIFNPQIGGKDYLKGLVEFEKIEPIMSSETFEQYLNSQGIDTSLLDISVDENEKSIVIHSESMTKTEMNEIFKNIKIFNYYDVFYKSRTSNTEGKLTKNVQFRKTLEKISHENSIVIFYGEMNYFKYLFADYTNIRFYLQNSGKQLFVLAKDVSSKKCYEKKENQFIENENCEIEKSSNEEDLDIGELMQELEENKIENSFNGVLQSESSIVTNVQTDNEEKFKQWWYANTKALNSYNEPLDQKTKNAYYNGLKRFTNEFSLSIFVEHNIEKLSTILQSLEKDGNNYEYNKKEGYNPSNGLKQYIKFLNGESNQENQLADENQLSMFTNKEIGNIKFSHQNILFKGVPGTGKSKTIDKIILDEDKLNMKEIQNNILRINIHSASSNSDLMQGISISTTDDKKNVIYKERQGAILSHIFKAIYKPKQPFVLVLEEIQENSLNELIGDLIYLIENTKRTIIELDIPNDTEISYEELFNKIEQKFKETDKTLHHIELPSLVENSNTNIKMIVPENLFIFCTSNYRDDKKVIEDNLLRRFDVIEIYPKNREQVGKDEKNDYIFKSDDVSKFLEKLNNQILNQFKNETHPDRYMIGHANWLDINEDDDENSQIAFYKALLKVIIEFKEVREIDFDSEVKAILEEVFKKDENISDRLEKYLNIFYNEDNLELKSYKNIVDLLQQKVYKSFF